MSHSFNGFGQSRITGELPVCCAIDLGRRQRHVTTVVLFDLKNTTM